jgi:hypothetical protein
VGRRWVLWTKPGSVICSTATSRTCGGSPADEWFGLIIGDGGLGRDVTVDIWVADGLVRRFDISSPDYGTQSVEFYDFNADITITPPPGPYAEPSAD